MKKVLITIGALALSLLVCNCGGSSDFAKKEKSEKKEDLTQPMEFEKIVVEGKRGLLINNQLSSSHHLQFEITLTLLPDGFYMSGYEKSVFLGAQGEESLCGRDFKNIKVESITNDDIEPIDFEEIEPLYICDAPAVYPLSIFYSKLTQIAEDGTSQFGYSGCGHTSAVINAQDLFDKIFVEVQKQPEACQ